MRAKKRREIPFEFVIEALQGLDMRTRPMFGCESVYVGDKIVLILRAKGKPKPDDGIWIATEREHHDSLREDFPSLRSIQLFGGDTDWQNLPVDDEKFEENALRLCEMIHAGDPRLGRVPKSRLGGGRKKLRKMRPKKSRAKPLRKGAAKKSSAKTKRKVARSKPRLKKSAPNLRRTK